MYQFKIQTNNYYLNREKFISGIIYDSIMEKIIFVIN